MEIGKSVLVKEMLLKSLNLHRDHYKSLQALGLMALKNQEFEEAVRYYEKAIQEGGTLDESYVNLGLAYWKLG